MEYRLRLIRLYDLECKLFSFYFQNRVSCEFVSDIDKLNTASVYAYVCMVFVEFVVVV